MLSTALPSWLAGVIAAANDAVKHAPPERTSIHARFSNNAREWREYREDDQQRVAQMPLKKTARLDRTVRNKIRQILRHFYHQLLTQRIPDRLSETIAAARKREPPTGPGSADRKNST